MRFVKGLTNSILTYVPNMIHICPNKTTTKNEHMREVINRSTHTYLLNTVKSININSSKALQEKSLWQEEFDNLYF